MNDDNSFCQNEANTYDVVISDWAQYEYEFEYIAIARYITFGYGISSGIKLLFGTISFILKNDCCRCLVSCLCCMSNIYDGVSMAVRVTEIGSNSCRQQRPSMPSWAQTSPKEKQLLHTIATVTVMRMVRIMKVSLLDKMLVPIYLREESHIYEDTN